MGQRMGLAFQSSFLSSSRVEIDIEGMRWNLVEASILRKRPMDECVAWGVRMHCVRPTAKLGQIQGNNLVQQKRLCHRYGYGEVQGHSPDRQSRHR